MIKISKIPVQLIKNLLFYSFLSFLLISIFHGHKYDIGIINVVYDNSDDGSEKIDQFLDSDLNCVIHSFSDSANLDFESSIIEDIELNKNTIIQKNDNLPKYSNYFQYKLRGPPIKLV